MLQCITLTTRTRAIIHSPIISPIILMVSLAITLRLIIHLLITQIIQSKPIAITPTTLVRITPMPITQIRITPIMPVDFRRFRSAHLIYLLVFLLPFYHHLVWVPFVCLIIAETKPMKLFSRNRNNFSLMQWFKADAPGCWLVVWLLTLLCITPLLPSPWVHLYGLLVQAVYFVGIFFLLRSKLRKEAICSESLVNVFLLSNISRTNNFLGNPSRQQRAGLHNQNRSKVISRN